MIFGIDKPNLSQDMFFSKMEALLQGSNSGKEVYTSALYTVFLYIDLFRVETLMIEDPELLINI